MNRKVIPPDMLYTPAGNYCESSSKNIPSYNWNEFFQENNFQNIFHVILWITTNMCM